MSEINDQSQLFQRSFLNDSTIIASSIGCKRISRRTNESSASRRSLSRRSSETSLDSSNVGRFFVKMSAIQKLEENTSTSTRNDILTRQAKGHQKKRSPTPAPGVLSRRKEKEIETVKMDVSMEHELLISKLQTKVTEEKQKNAMYQRKCILLEKDLKVKITRISQLQKSLEQAFLKEKNLENVIKQFQKKVQLNEANLQNTKSKLQRFKNNIMVNRMAEMESENLKLRRETQQIKKKISLCEQQNKKFEQKCIFLEKQLFRSKNRLNRDSLDFIGTLKSDNLEKMIQTRDEYTMKLESNISKLEIQLNYMNRKKLQEIMQFREKKDKQLSRVRNRLLSLNKQLQEVKKENQRLKRGSCLALSRTSIMSSTTWTTRQDVLELSLSPDHFQC